MLTSKQRAYLRSLGNELEPIVQVGKGGLSPNLITQVDEALEARELLKVRVLKNALADVRDVAEELAEETDADVVQVIGNIIMLYREASKDPQIIFALGVKGASFSDEKRVSSTRLTGLWSRLVPAV